MALRVQKPKTKTFLQKLAEVIDIATIKTRLQLPSNGAWQSVGAAGKPAFGAGWSNHPGGGTGWPSTVMTTNYPVQYRKDSIGMVHLRGILDLGEAAGKIFTLPSGFRPSKDTAFACPAPPSAGQDFTVVIIRTNGDVSCQFGTNEPFELSGIHFFTD